ncbi:MAG TPA: serine hydrolase domain-containing protein [Gemmatimonadales bacterium]|nr:serine hydrolase domain-containing protein [Gemmatimonadales bacterium]
MRWIRRTMLGAATGAVTLSPLAAQRPDRARVEAVTDSVVAAALATGQAAGMTVAVVRGRDTLVLKGYGAADLELDVPTPAAAIYEIGSITKQFTAVAILQLAEQGKLSLDDELTTHFPDYPVRGQRITVRHLLDHTSGIASYTDLPGFEALSVRALPPDSVVAFFSGQPPTFAPGAQLSYNNSAYFLLGLLIEKASGLTYAEYVQQKLFEPAGMVDSRYCSENAVVKRRAHGYDMGPKGLVRAGYLVHTWPFAAGSLCSTAGDLVAWNRALHGVKLLSERSYRELVTPGSLNDGTRLRYAKGVAVDSLHGRRTVHHGGDINGFTSELQWYPDGEVTIAVLLNTLGPVRPHAIAHAIGQALFGTPARRATPLRGSVSDYAGEYRAGPEADAMAVTIEPDAARTGLQVRMGPRPGVAMTFAGVDTFDAPGAPVGNVRFTFLREGGEVTAVRFDPVFFNLVLKRQPAPR